MPGSRGAVFCLLSGPHGGDAHTRHSSGSVCADATPQIGRPWPGDLIAVLRQVGCVRTVQKKSKAGCGSAAIVPDGYARVGRGHFESGRNAVPCPQGASVVLCRCRNQACLRIRVARIGTNLGLNFGGVDARTAGRTDEFQTHQQQGSASGDSVAHGLCIPVGMPAAAAPQKIRQPKANFSASSAWCWPIKHFRRATTE